MPEEIRIVDGLKEVTITMSRKLFDAVVKEMSRVTHHISKGKVTKVNPVLVGVKVMIVKEMVLKRTKTRKEKDIYASPKVAKRARKEKR